MSRLSKFKKFISEVTPPDGAKAKSWCHLVTIRKANLFYDKDVEALATRVSCDNSPTQECFTCIGEMEFAFKLLKELNHVALTNPPLTSRR